MKSTNTISFIQAVSKLMDDPKMVENPSLMKKEIIQLIRNPKFQKATMGRKIVKALKVPSGVVKLLNAEISISAKKEILDQVLSSLNEKEMESEMSNSSLKSNPEKRVAQLDLIERQGKSLFLEEEPLPTYSIHSAGSSGETHFGKNY